MTHNVSKSQTIWTLVITSVALFMVSLDNLVVTTALPVIRRDLHATISQLEWTVNAYTLTFAVLLLTGAALGDRFGRRRMFVVGILLFTGASALASTGLLGIVWGLVRGNDHGWTSFGIVTPLAVGAFLVAAFVAWELRASSPMLPMEFFRNRTFALTNVASLFMFFGMFGSIFLLAQFFQTVQGYSPLDSGMRILPWTAMPMIVAPIAGALSDRIGGQRLMAAGLALQSAGLLWIAAVSTPTTPYLDLVGPFVLSGIGLGLFFAPVANVVLSSVRPEQEGKASGATNAIRELGGVFGGAVLAAVFSHVGGYQSGTAFVNGTTSAVYVGGAVVARGAVAAALIKRRPAPAAQAQEVEPVLEAAA